ncbi:hypothetical protein [Brachybacterium sp. YJGR34]|uniref:hypothetical protein n=1 Tax=Brachybacterium sp. YJGR34 TaxID=2059911 RepID=UPI000E0AD77B|nr:hypothetical protein [Brachybacterium sp. YJGR34]
MRRPRRLVLAAAALGLALSASGCAVFSPVQTHDFYQAADGTNATLEQDGASVAGVRNAVLYLAEDGTATFFATVVNYSDQDISVELEGLEGSSSLFDATVTVPAHETVRLGSGEDQQEVPVGEVAAVPGSILDLEVSAEGLSETISLPTVEGSLGHFEQPAAAEEQPAS